MVLWHATKARRGQASAAHPRSIARAFGGYVFKVKGGLAEVRGSVQGDIHMRWRPGVGASSTTEPRSGADALQPPLRSGFRARLTASVRHHSARIVTCPSLSLTSM